MPLRIRVAARLIRRAVRQAETPLVHLPVFLCPAFSTISWNQVSQRRSLHSSTEPANTLPQNDPSIGQAARDLRVAALFKRLPQQCSGCGALSQTVDKNEPGYFDLVKQRKSIKKYLAGTTESSESEEDTIFEKAIAQAKLKDPKYAETYGFDIIPKKGVDSIATPVCERCHYLKNQSIAVPIHHPSIQSIQDTIFESPYKYNHIYHIIDAVDFPMSLIPGIHKILSLTPQRSLNRRSKTGRFYHGKKTDISFVITRSDLLAPTKAQVDAMMPYLRSVLRDSLGRAGADVRLGNIRCVSAKQSWWTKELKEEIWNRGGGGWMVGKVNVGKSQLFHEVFPKGRRSEAETVIPWKASTALGTQAYEIADNAGESSLIENSDNHPLSGSRESSERNSEADVDAENSAPAAPLEKGYLDDETLDTFSLLPPAQIEQDYPTMPLVSSLPGTTASPIRVPFGNGKGELIDLPGLSRGDLEQHVQPEHRSSLILRSRVRPEQQVLKPGQSLLLGGLVRITPTTPDVIFLAYSFIPFHSHLTSTQKAIEIQDGTRTSDVGNIALPSILGKIKSAGTFHLKWDVTKQRTGPITARDAAGIKVEQLPFRVMSADILIEGCGWVELTAQIRKRPGEMSAYPEHPDEDRGDIDPQWPTLEVFTPDGKYIAIRKPLNAWLNFAEKPSEKRARARPRRSMKGTAKLTKQRGREKVKMNV